MRKLASIRVISSISPIEGADSIEVATVDGWKVVIRKGEYEVGDVVVYCEIDSWIPHKLAPFLSKGKEPKEFEGVKGERLRTVKLRGQISQGLLLPESIASESIAPGEPYFCEIGTDVTEVLGIKKWELPMPQELTGVAKGAFPRFIPKTDQERVQNLVKEVEQAQSASKKFEVTEKLEGSSMTCYLTKEGVFGVCSRNLDLERNEDNTFWNVAIKLDIEQKMRALGCDLAIQGELIGPGIQGNIYGLNSHEFLVFDVYDISLGKYMLPDARRALVESMGLKHVPLVHSSFPVEGGVDELLKLAEDFSKLSKTQREGVVFKEVDGAFTFKAISGVYLLKQK